MSEQEFIPEFEVVLKMVCAHLQALGKTYVEIAYDPQTKEIAHSFEATLPPPFGHSKN